MTLSGTELMYCCCDCKPQSRKVFPQSFIDHHWVSMVWRHVPLIYSRHHSKADRSHTSLPFRSVFIRNLFNERISALSNKFRNGWLLLGFLWMLNSYEKSSSLLLCDFIGIEKLLIKSAELKLPGGWLLLWYPSSISHFWFPARPSPLYFASPLIDRIKYVIFNDHS